MLRPYQQEAHDAIIAWIKKTRAPCLIEAATGAGKSHIIAALASTIHSMSGGKHVLCLAPSAELVIQNSEKYASTGNLFSIFSASAGKISLRHPVVFGTPLTVANRIKKFGSQFAMVIIDESHGITPTVKSIVEAMREQNENIRVVGMTATPYRMGSGYIFGQWPDGKPVPKHETENPYFAACVNRITARQLIEMGYLTKPVIGQIHAESYHTLEMKLNARGQFDAEDVDRAYVGQGRKTADIIADVVAQARDRHGVMIFAATIRHAQECLESLPPELSALVTGDTPRAERKDIIDRFKAREIKYLVNVSVLTTGFDAPHVDLIAMLRATESVGLLQQIIGRGLRLSEGKDDCLILDYAENVERHCPDGDVFDPTIKTVKASDEDEYIECECPQCGSKNGFKVRPNPSGFKCDDAGYFTDLDGQRVPSDHGDIPAHFGRRCQAKTIVRGDLIQCGYRWTFKECPHCNAENDIAARYCSECKGEIVDPNEKLKAAYREMKKDPTRRQTDKVLGWTAASSMSKAGREMWRVSVVTPIRTFTFWVPKSPTWPQGITDRGLFLALKGQKPETITYQKDASTGFYRVYGYNRKADEIPA
jgi:DNA repair protein RadD